MDLHTSNMDEPCLPGIVPLMEGSRPAYGNDCQSPATPDSKADVVSAACISCRTKHLKCNGEMPCSRCATAGLSAVSCTYVRSRRGYKGPRRNAKQVPETTSRQNLSSGPSSVEDDSTISGLIAVTENSAQTQPNSRGQDELALLLRSSDNRLAVNPVDSHIASQWAPTTDPRTRCFEAFFRFFSQAHPFVLPKPYLTQMLKTKLLLQLEAAIRYVGSHYVKSAPSELIAQEATQLLSSPNCVQDGFTVQAMLLLAMGFDGNAEFDKANDMLKQAQDLALKIGMNNQAFAVMNGEGVAVLEESWRRTWWELYVVDGMIAGVHQQTSFRLNELPIEVLLPCEEQEYISGQIPLSYSFQDLDDQTFAEDEITFSSFAYRIAAIRNLGRILQLQRILFVDDPAVDQIDAYLVNWNLHRPDSKKLAVSGDGQLDEMLFQGLMITAASTILLHRPLSQLDTSVVRDVTSCAPFRAVAPSQVYNTHTAKILQSAEGISKLITLPVPLIRHTQFFTCVITLASIVHLSCWAALSPLGFDENLKQQIRLNIGALKSLAEAWPSATRAGNQVRSVAQEVFASRKLAVSEGFWGTLTDDEMMRSMIEDESIITNFHVD